MSRKVNNLRKRLRILEAMRAKEIRNASDTIQLLRKRLSEATKASAESNPAVTLLVRPSGMLPGRRYAMQMEFDVDAVRWFTLRDGRFTDGERAYLMIEERMRRELRRLFQEVVFPDHPTHKG